MTSVLEFKEKIRSIYFQYSTWIDAVMKFLSALLVFVNINGMIGMHPVLSNVFVLLILAVLCSVLPMGATAFFGCLLIVGHSYALGIDVAAFALLILLLLYFLYVRFAPRDLISLVATPLAFQLQVPCAVPVGFGLFGNVGSGISAACGCIVYYLLRVVQDQMALAESGEKAEIAVRIREMFDGLMLNQELWINIIAFAMIFLLVYSIGRMSFDYSKMIAIFIGSVAYPLVLVLGVFLADVEVAVLPMIVGTIVGLVLMLLVNFSVRGLDYTRPEYLQYEDDDYYYYVKAIPKIRISGSERSVKTFSGKKAEKDVM